MKPNISFFDTILRIFIGATVGAIFSVLDNPIGILAVYPIVTALIAWDPIYYKMGWFTTECNPYTEEVAPVAKVVAPVENPYKMTA